MGISAAPRFWHGPVQGAELLPQSDDPHFLHRIFLASRSLSALKIPQLFDGKGDISVVQIYPLTHPAPESRKVI